MTEAEREMVGRVTAEGEFYGTGTYHEAAP
jgi:hypothetical protein